MLLGETSGCGYAEAVKAMVRRGFITPVETFEPKQSL